MTAQLVAFDLPGGPAFVAALQRVWDRGDAAFPVDQRLPPAAKAALIATMATGSAIDASGAIYISTTGNPNIPGLTGLADEDVMRFVPSALGSATSGAW